MKRSIGNIASLSLMLIALSGPAPAQETGPAMSVGEIAICLCLEPQLDEARNDIAAKRAALKEREEQLSLLSAEIAKKRASLDPADTVGQTVLKNLSNQAILLRQHIRDQAQPALNQAVADYNALAGTYNRDCTTRPRYAADVENARKALVCTPP
jgi:multidrug resistance efflux pump